MTRSGTAHRSPRRARTLLKTLHLWLGLSLGVVLALVALSGSVLLFEDQLVVAGHPELTGHAVPDPTTQGRALQHILGSPDGSALRSISPPDEALPVWDGGLKGGDHVYFDAATGEPVLRRKASGDGLLILKDWHTHLLSGPVGETILGVVAWAGLFMLLSGVWLYWPGRRRALTHLRPHPRPAILRWASWHRFVGVVAFPLLLVMLGTGTTMAYRGAVRAGLVSAFGEPAPRKPPPVPSSTSLVDWPAVLNAAHAAAPDAEITRIMLPVRDGAALVLRIRRPGEWNIAGRSTLWIDAPDARVIGGEDATRLGTGGTLANTLFPIHTAAVGGTLWRVVACITGVLPMFLMVTGFLFWRARRNRPPAMRTT
ncbi:putative iron-regulated membrane protein [Luteibacter rhizovicinus]|uniref:Putative iron-regulated membrane protein n=1 Tax=Luteibacter rhizovicinus TaxID=242606 RepID=A0A4R3YKF5_9GAMM|nr:PepSY-associated TM helix domain-containing protein [Luteibacter rhizovicinus]TCV92746.1 putative iron-regulated membrane protein [Luteibacter rhizovicinus]